MYFSKFYRKAFLLLNAAVRIEATMKNIYSPNVASWRALSLDLNLST